MPRTRSTARPLTLTLALPIALALALVPALVTASPASASSETASPATASSATGSHRWAGRTISLGAIFSTTGIGIAYGPEQVKGADLAVDQINSRGGVHGAHIHLTVLNDNSVPATSASRMTTLITKDDVLAVLGPTFSNSAASADPVADGLQTPVLAVSNTGSGIVGTCAYPCTWIFRDSLGEATALPANIDTYVSHAHPKTASVLYTGTDPFAASTAQIAVQTLGAKGVRVLTSTVVPDPSQSTAAVTQALAGDPAAVVVTTSSAVSGGDIVEALRSQGFTGQILGGNAFNSPTAATTAGKAGKGVQSAAAWFLGSTSAANRAFVSAYRARYHAAPDQFAALAYTGVELLAKAATSAPLTFGAVAHDRAALAASLAKVQATTPLGQFRFTADHDVYQKIWIVAMTGTGGYRLVRVLPAPAPAR